MIENSHDDKVVQEAFRNSKDTLLRRLPIHTLPAELEGERIISAEERSLITAGNSSSMQQREKLVEMLLTKDGRALLKVLEILKTKECGYETLVDQLLTEMDMLMPFRSQGKSESSDLLNPLTQSSRKQSTPRTYGANIYIPSMPIELQVISSVLLEDKVYVTGIATDAVPMSHQVQVYSLVDGKWSVLPEAHKLKPTPNYNAPIAIVDDRITLIGGRDTETRKITNILSTWLEEERKWKQVLPPMPTERLASGVCLHDSLLLVAGGIVESTVEEGRVVNTVDVYEFGTARWSTPKALDLPKPLRSHHLVVFKENIYLMGGATAFPAPPDPEDLFNHQAWRAKWSDVKETIKQDAHADPIKGMWTPITNPPVLRPTIVSNENSLICIGGMNDGLPQNAIYRFDEGKTDSCWVKMGNMSVGRYRHAVVPLGMQGMALFVAGGFVPGKPMEEEAHTKSDSVELVLL